MHSDHTLRRFTCKCIQELRDAEYLRREEFKKHGDGQARQYDDDDKEEDHIIGGAVDPIILTSQSYSDLVVIRNAKFKSIDVEVEHSPKGKQLRETFHEQRQSSPSQSPEPICEHHDDIRQKILDDMAVAVGKYDSTAYDATTAAELVVPDTVDMTVSEVTSNGSGLLLSSQQQLKFRPEGRRPAVESVAVLEMHNTKLQIEAHDTKPKQTLNGKKMFSRRSNLGFSTFTPRIQSGPVHEQHVADGDSTLPNISDIAECEEEDVSWS